MNLKPVFGVFASSCLLLGAGGAMAEIITQGSVNPTIVGPDEVTVSGTGLAVGGDFTAAGDGVVEIANGSKLTVDASPTPVAAPFVNLAPLPGASGRLSVSGGSIGGVPSTLRIEGATADSGAFLTVGRGGSGHLVVDSGGLVEIDSLGASLGRGIPGLGFPAGFNIARDAGSIGLIELSGTGSEMRVSSDFAFGAIAREGDGRMDIRDGARLLFTGINSDLNVSSDRGVPLPGTGGSRHGELHVATGGQISGPVFLNVGGSVGGTGALTLDGNDSRIALAGACTADCPVGFSFPDQGAFLGIGVNEGEGHVAITGGAELRIDSTSAPGAENVGFALGGSSILGPRGEGHLLVSGAGSELRVIGDQAFFAIGRLQQGTGSMTIEKGGRVVVENGDSGSRGFIGDRPGASGTVTVDGENSLFDAGRYLGVGVDSGGAEDQGKGTLKLSDGGTVLANIIEVAAGGQIMGNGIMAASDADKIQVRIDEFGNIAAGLSVGELVIDGDLVFAGGSMTVEAEGPGQIDKVLVAGDLLLLDGFIDILVGYVPQPDEALSFFDVGGVFEFDPAFDGFRVFASPGSGLAVGTEIAIGIGNAIFTAVVSTVPAPSTLALVVLALAAGGTLRRCARLDRPHPTTAH
ncbi:MAG: hypothetical protein KDG52_03740 [Rhodocyclaceae bacterium]|nr:hypothetical protein [Rhodocyclaceae bacterium]